MRGSTNYLRDQDAEKELNNINVIESFEIISLIIIIY